MTETETATGRPARRATLERTTSESSVRVSVDLDGTGASTISTGVGFYDHMLTALARHALLDLEVSATGDTYLDAHHTVEDTAIVLGQAIRQALGDKAGIARFGDATVPLDEALTRAVVDLSGRPYLVHGGRTLKRLKRMDNRLWLVPEAEGYPHTIVDENVEVWGVVVGLARRYVA